MIAGLLISILLNLILGGIIYVMLTDKKDSTIEADEKEKGAITSSIDDTKKDLSNENKKNYNDSDSAADAINRAMQDQ